jgi:hypothetical protein
VKRVFLNSIRRTITDDIPCLVVDAEHESARVQVRARDMTAEKLRKRIRSVPVMALRGTEVPADMDLSRYRVRVRKENNTDSMERVDTKQWHVYLDGDRSDEHEGRRWFEASEVGTTTGAEYWITLAQLGGKLTNVALPDYVDIDCPLVLTTPLGGHEAAVGRCGVGNIVDRDAMREQVDRMKAQGRTEREVHDFEHGAAEIDCAVPDASEVCITALAAYSPRELLAAAVGVLSGRFRALRFERVEPTRGRSDRCFDVVFADPDGGMSALTEIIVADLYAQHFVAPEPEALDRKPRPMQLQYVQSRCPDPDAATYVIRLEFWERPKDSSAEDTVRVMLTDAIEHRILPTFHNIAAAWD